MIPSPVNMGLTEWADQLSFLLGVSRLTNENDWKIWGARISNAPNPFYFDNWKEWAERFYGVTI